MPLARRRTHGGRGGGGCSEAALAETVYLFGAGINRSMRTSGGLRPPLANDLFQQALQHEMLGADGLRDLKELFGYIERYWKLSVDSLRERPFDIEASFTLLQQQQIEHADTLHVGYLAQIEDQLAALLARFIGEVENYMAADLLELGSRLLEERPAVLTFNYDTIIESVIEFASGLSDLPEPAEGRVPDEKLSYSSHNWNRALAYSVRFDEVELQQTGTLLEPVPGERFYGHPGNSLYDPPILKLHGSLNWLTHTSRPAFPEYPESHETRSNPKNGLVVLKSGFPWVRPDFSPPDDGFKWILEPVIVTPVLHKNLGGDGLIGQSWRRARRELSECRRLVVGGYSFPPSDFAVRKLFLEAFVEGPPDELVVINPDRSAAETAASLCHFKSNPVVSPNLGQYLGVP
jgi:hypothetical protein